MRGAPAIGATGAYALAQAALEYGGEEFNDFKKYIDDSFSVINSARPTANDLNYALNFVRSKMFMGQQGG